MPYLIESVSMPKYLHPLSMVFLLLILLSACSSGVDVFTSGNWQAGSLTQQHIHTLVVDPNNPHNIYAGDLQDGVYVSTDGGLHWQRRSAGLPSPSTVNALAFDDSGKKLYAATDTGLFVSANTAQSWTMVSTLPADGYSSIAFDLKATPTIFVTSQHHGLLYSSDRAKTWASINSGLPAHITINTLTFDSNQRQLWAATDQGIYLSGNNGASWQAVNNGLPTGTHINEALPASIYGGDANTVYAATSQGFYLSQNQGAHWMISQTPLARVDILAIIIDVQSVSTLYIATDKVGVLRSTDKGEDWSTLAPGLPGNQSIYAISEGAANYTQLFAAANNVYIFPGTSSVFDPTQLIPLLLVIIFFYLLYRLIARGRRRSRDMLKPERIIEQSEPPRSGPDS